jgi:hypothetical protein
MPLFEKPALALFHPLVKSYRVICRGAIHCAHRQCIGLGWGRNSLRPYTISSRFTRKDAEPFVLPTLQLTRNLLQ